MRNNFLLSTILIIIAAVLYGYFIKPWATVAYEKYNNVEQLKETLLQADKIQQKRDELQSVRNNLSESTEDAIVGSIPEDTVENKIQFFIALDSLIAQSGLASDTRYSIRKEQEEGSEGTTIPISFDFDEVNYTILREFIGNIQRWNRGVRIKSLRIVSQKNEGSPDLVGGASIELEAFFTKMANDSP